MKLIDYCTFYGGKHQTNDKRWINESPLEEMNRWLKDKDFDENRIISVETINNNSTYGVSYLKLWYFKE